MPDDAYVRGAMCGNLLCLYTYADTGGTCARWNGVLFDRKTVTTRRGRAAGLCWDRHNSTPGVRLLGGSHGAKGRF